MVRRSRCLYFSNALGWWAALTILHFSKEQMSWVHIGIFGQWTLTLSPFCHRTLRWSNNLGVFSGGHGRRTDGPRPYSFICPGMCRSGATWVTASIGVSAACLLLWSVEPFFQRGKRVGIEV